ncbi:MAG: cation diffusion facilitator family transporter [Roseburia sp.]|nr:cation diffusion facilitator family transporter [Roseburia sp.]MCM1430228.1 cation diffusion facilitator family transporter [Muribaculaceae bacterium]
MNEKISANVSDAEFHKTANRVSAVSIAGNLLLSVFKLFAGVIAHSGAMISDAVHSASDVFSSIVVIIGVYVSSREADEDHPYGHERLECVAAIILATVLLITGLSIGGSALRTVMDGRYEKLAAPGILALLAAVVSIACKEAMFWYTKVHAKRINSAALMADAWHHRSDALSSVGALIGIGGARLGFPILDPIASLVITVFIVKAAYDIFKDAVDKMVDHACDSGTEQIIADFIRSEEGVIALDSLRTRVFGTKIYVDVEIAVDAELPLKDAHEIAERLHDHIEFRFDTVKHVMVHVNPYNNAG